MVKYYFDTFLLFLEGLSFTFEAADTLSTKVTACLPLIIYSISRQNILWQGSLIWPGIVVLKVCDRRSICTGMIDQHNRQIRATFWSKYLIDQEDEWIYVLKVKQNKISWSNCLQISKGNKGLILRWGQQFTPDED